jgi:hypothetical protein
VILLLSGLVLLAISLSPIPRTQILVNGTEVGVKPPYTSYGVSASYFLKGNSNGKINGTLLTFEQCCVDFYIFTSTAWSNFLSDNLSATNSTNSPVLTVSSSAIDAKNGVSATFTFYPNSNEVYELVFLNTNRSQWNTNSTEVVHVIADIDLFYSQAPAGFLIYPAAVLILAAVGLIIVRIRYVK